MGTWGQLETAGCGGCMGLNSPPPPNFVPSTGVCVIWADDDGGQHVKGV